MRQIFHIFLFLHLTNTGLSQTDFVTKKTILPNDLKDKIISIKIAQYQNDTLTNEFEFLTVNFTKENKLKKITCHKKIVAENYYLIKPYESIYFHKRHKEIIKTSYTADKEEMFIKYFKDTLIIKSKFITKGGLKWVKTMHQKKHLEWTREKYVLTYIYDTKLNNVIKKDKDGNVYTTEDDQYKNCIKVTYTYKNSLSWIQSFKYDSNNNMIEMIETNDSGKINWRITNDYNDKNLLICNKHFVSGETLFSQINFIYQDNILNRREDIDFKNNSKIIYYYSYK